MLCVHSSRWLKGIKEKIITAIDDIDDRERYTLVFLDFFFFSQNFDYNIPHISQSTWPHKSMYDSPNQTNKYGH